MKCCEAFEILAEVGDDPEPCEKGLERARPIYDGLLKKARLSRASEVLDLGTGTGPIAIESARCVGPKGRVLGIDVNKRMLRVARGKNSKLGLRNLDFRLMNMEDLAMEDGMYDNVVSSFGICCCFHYDRTLSEAFRVLKDGGCITFSQAGPRHTAQEAVFAKVLAKYKTRVPSTLLKKRREASDLQSEMVSEYQIPSPTTRLMKSLGFQACEASIVKYEITFADVAEYLDSTLTGSYEFREMTRGERVRFTKECSSKLGIYQTERGFITNSEVVFFSGAKPTC